MKVTYIIGIVVIAVLVGILLSTSGQSSSYVDFGTAEEMAKESSAEKVHVVGSVKKDAAGNMMLAYNPAQDPNLFQFILVDEKNNEKEVVYFNPKPQDFESAEKVVIIGSVKENKFVADKILMKCPSKYQEGDPEFVEAKASM